MTTVHAPIRTALRRAGVAATLAPSVHNTQPWRLVVGADRLDLYADWSRKLGVIDPHGRQLLLSCGCALFNARVGMAAAGYGSDVVLFPDLDQPDLIARISVSEGAGDSLALHQMEAMLTLRRTNRRPFAEDSVDPDLVARLVTGAELDGAELVEVTGQQERIVLAALSQQAARLQNADAAYRAELRAWTSDDPARVDGVLAVVVPHVDGTARDDLPIRDFDQDGNGALPSQTHSSMFQTLLVLATAGDTAKAWVQAGEALERILLDIAGHGYAVSPFTQVIEMASTRQALRSALGLSSHPHIVLRVGRAPSTPQTRRRPLVDVLDEVQ